MRTIVLSVLVWWVCAGLLIVPAVRAQAEGAVTGTVVSSMGEPLARVAIQLRSLVNGEVMGSTVTNAAGEFTFTALELGNYVAEVVGDTGTVLASSGTLTVTAGTTVLTGAVITVPSITAAAATVGGISTAAVVSAAAAGAGVLTTVATLRAASEGQP